jgi:hypothetical protein
MGVMESSVEKFNDAILKRANLTKGKAKLPGSDLAAK